MNHFHFKDGEMHAEGVPLERIRATFGSPTFVYSDAALVEAVTAFARPFARAPLVCYAVKANSNIAILNRLAGIGCGFDIVSGGELTRVLRAGGDPRKTVFSGVGKTRDEIRQALNADILCFNVESASELRAVTQVAAEVGSRAPISIRVNPDVDAGTHPYIATGLRETKFGVTPDVALELYDAASREPALEVVGIDCHIGSQILSVEPFAEALTRLLPIIDELERRGIHLQHLDLGGGIGVTYKNETPVATDEYASALTQTLGARDLPLIFEPGRYIAANAGVLVTEVLYLKVAEAGNFAIIDAAMNDLIRPALYDAWQAVHNLHQGSGPERIYDLVGPVCETGDFIARGRKLRLTEGDGLAIMSAGAYGMAMSSNYNSRNRAAEVLVRGDDFHLIRERETIDDQLRGERLAPPVT
jgi:diaminopimelate decarboxylase